MRILKNIPHPYLKITVFKHQQTLSIKFQHQVYETILTFRDGEIKDEGSFLSYLPNSSFIHEMEQRIHEIHKSRMAVLNKFNKTG